MTRNVKLTGLSLLLGVNLFLIFWIKNDFESQRKQPLFLKNNSPYFSQFSKTYKDKIILLAEEKDLTTDGKVEFLILSKKSNCPECKNNLAIFQGERKIFELETATNLIETKAGGFVLRNGKEKFFQWQGSGFREVSELTQTG